MFKKLSKHGNSFAIVIDKAILELLNINENTQFKLKTDGRVLIMEPVQVLESESVISQDKKLEQKYKKLIEKYGPALKKLAEN